MLCSYCKGKGQPAQDLDSAAANGHRGDLSVVAGADAGIRKPEAGVIEDVGCVGTNLEDAFSPNMEVFAKRKLDVGKRPGPYTLSPRTFPEVAGSGCHSAQIPLNLVLA
jgi:hypothetical protein